MPARDSSAHLPAPQAAPSERQTMEAWERFVTGQEVVAGCVSKHVWSSWQRSRRHGVEPATRLAPIAVAGDGLEQLRLRNQMLMAAAKGLFMTTAHLLARSGSIMLLTDAQGVVLEMAGDHGTMAAARDIRLIEGGNWNEGVIGTNGIGTALAMRTPAQVHTTEHFCSGIKLWVCAAAPIFMPGTDQILGVVDISCPPASYQVNNLALAVASARQIEAVLAERISQEHRRLLEACLQMSGRADSQALLALDRNACLVHSSGNAPGLDLRQGARVAGLEPGHCIEDWARRLPENLRSEWLHPVTLNGAFIGGLLMVPKSSRGTPKSVVVADSETKTPGHEWGVSSTPIPDKGGFAKLVWNSRAMHTAIERAQQVSARRVPVLIQGETGVGKELFARAIHGDDERNGPFVTFNCGATTKELIGSELFGHVRGAFTGATNEGRAGRFELAHGGTLCLDEIGELPLDLQPVLLRVLEEGVIYRLGDGKPRHVNVRLLAMTNRDLLQEVEAGRFRRDLYHRINVTRVRVPPLRERERDIELLMEHFNLQLSLRHGVPVRHFGPEVRAAMRAYSWPGNVRELRNLVESLLLTSDQDAVLLSELPEELLAAIDQPQVAVQEAPVTSLEEGERLAIVRAIKDCQGNLAKAARALGVSRSTLYRKVERYRLEDLVRPSAGKESDSPNPSS
ncbi:MAG: sigma-54-dependent Fis family transcriptional regulator [Burkholderiales bacterium PBB1]|nr:MAG: sigma-54-dependent Fis family transcriptional regulator [Burkholderiales bacterium PBB1]